MNNSAIPYWLTFAVLLAALYGGFKWYQTEKSRWAPAPLVDLDLPPLEEFELTTSDGKIFRSEEMKGKVWVVSFFFSTCPGSCKRLNSNIKYLASLDEIGDVTWVSITVDPVTDTLPVLESYADSFNASDNWLFARADFDYVRRIAHDVLKVGGVSLKDHNDYAVIIDKQGEINSMFRAVSNEESKRGVETLKKLLAEEYQPKSKTENSQPAGEDAAAPGRSTPKRAEAA